MSAVGHRITLRMVLVVGAVVALLLAGVVSYYASSAPDGLNRVAIDKSLDRNEVEHRFADSPLADYEVTGVDNGRLASGMAGVAGVAITFALAGGGVLLLRRRRPAASPR